jgi:uncharacterized protein DUF6401
MRGDLSLVGEMSLWLAGEAGQVSLALTAEGADLRAAGLRSAVDQHAAEVRDALGEPMTASCLMSYARGFTEAAVGRGWWPPHRRSPAHGLDPGMLAGDELDWESLRLAAVCRLYLQAQGLAPQM